MIDDPPGFRQYWSADYHDTFPDEALNVFLDAGARRASPMTQHLLLPWGGALARVDADATPLSQRSARWVSIRSRPGLDPADDAANLAWVRNYRRANAPFTTGGVYLNFIGDEGEGRIKAAFGVESTSDWHRSSLKTTPATSSPATRISAPRCLPDNRRLARTTAPTPSSGPRAQASTSGSGSDERTCVSIQEDAEATSAHRGSRSILHAVTPHRRAIHLVLVQDANFPAHVMSIGNRTGLSGSLSARTWQQEGKVA